jgi:hypothetical protein
MYRRVAQVKALTREWSATQASESCAKKNGEHESKMF